MPSRTPTLQVRLSPTLRARLDRQAERRVVSRSYLINLALERLLGELEDTMDQLDNYLED